MAANNKHQQEVYRRLEVELQDIIGESDDEHVTEGQQKAIEDDGSVNEEVNDDWEIDAVVLGNGESRGGVVLEKGKWYGCSQMVGDISSYHVVEKESITMPDYGRRQVAFGAFRLTNHGNVPLTCDAGIRKNRDLDRSDRILRKVLQYCEKYPGMAVITSGPGAREASMELKRYIAHGVEGPICRSDALDCVPAALVNGIGCLLGKDMAMVAMRKLQKEVRHLRNMKQVVPLLHRLEMKLHLRKYREWKEMFDKRFGEAFAIISKWKDGLWMVRLVTARGKRVDHCVLVDAKNSVILDSVEDFPIKLCERSLRLCGGDGEGIHVAELWELHK